MHLFKSHPAIALHPKQLTVNWAQHIIKQHSPNTIVDKVEIISVDTGTTTRIRIKTHHSGPESLPKHWFIKIPSLSWKARAITALPRLLHTETRFYNELAEHTPINKPIALSAKSHFSKGSTLVLSDLSEQGAIPGHPCDTLSIEQAQLMVEQLALLHAKFWNKTHNNSQYNWLAGPVRKLEDHLGTALAIPLMKRGLKKANNLLTNTLHEPTITYARQRRKVMHFLNQGPQTVIHHDCHPGNLFWQNNKPGLLDWQMVRIGEGISDIAYLLATSLKPEDRKKHELMLIKHYTLTLSNLGITNIITEQLHQRYRAHLIYPLEAMIITLAVGGMMELNANHTLIKRTASAVEDNNTFAALAL